MGLHHIGITNDGDSVSDRLFFEYVNSKILNKSDCFSDDEISFVKYMILTARDIAVKMRTKTNNSRFEAIIFHMNILLCNNAFKNVVYFDRALKRKKSILERNRLILYIYNLWNELTNSMSALNYICNTVEYLDEANEWSDKDVLVGSLRSREQLDICLSCGFYHVPAEQIENYNGVKYIAIYQSKNLFGQYGGIYYWGKVVKTESVKRSAISEIPKKSDQPYIKFTIDKWFRLDNPIVSSGGGSIFGYTNLFMLLRAKDIFQLYFSDFEEYKFFVALNQAISENYNNVAYKYKSVIIVIKDGYISVLHNKNEIFKISVKDYCRNNGLWFIRLKNACNIE